MDRSEDHKLVPPGWLEALAESKAQIEAGKAVPLEAVLQRLRASATGMEARRAERPPRVVHKA